MSFVQRAHASEVVFRALARLAGVAPPSARWRRLGAETFDNSIGELVLDERSAIVTILRSAQDGENTERFVALHTTELTNDPRSATS